MSKYGNLLTLGFQEIGDFSCISFLLNIFCLFKRMEIRNLPSPVTLLELLM